MKLRQTFEHPVNGRWDGGPKQEFDWEIESGTTRSDAKGKFVRVGSWAANHWFCVAVGRSERETLSFALKRLRVRTHIPCTFEYVL